MYESYSQTILGKDRLKVGTINMFKKFVLMVCLSEKSASSIVTSTVTL